MLQNAGQFLPSGLLSKVKGPISKGDATRATKREIYTECAAGNNEVIPSNPYTFKATYGRSVVPQNQNETAHPLIPIEWCKCKVGTSQILPSLPMEYNQLLKKPRKHHLHRERWSPHGNNYSSQPTEAMQMQSRNYRKTSTQLNGSMVRRNDGRGRVEYRREEENNGNCEEGSTR